MFLKHFFIFLISISEIAKAKNATNSIIIAPDMQIIKVDYTNMKESPIKALNVLRHCGGQGLITQWRYETCTGTKGICHSIADGNARLSEVDFIPSENIPVLGWRFVLVKKNSKQTVYDTTLPNSAVEKGSLYTIKIKGGGTSDLKGQLITLRYILYRKADNQVEACVEGDFQVME